MNKIFFLKKSEKNTLKKSLYVDLIGHEFYRIQSYTKSNTVDPVFDQSSNSLTQIVRKTK